MTRLEIVNGPLKLSLMLALFDTDMGQRTVTFRTAHNPNDIFVRVDSARRRDSRAASWDIEGTVNVLGSQEGWVPVAICYYSDMQTGLMTIFDEEPRVNIVFETPNDAKRAKALMIIIQKMVAIAENYGGLPDSFYSLFEKAKPISWAKDSESLTKAISDIK